MRKNNKHIAILLYCHIAYMMRKYQNSNITIGQYSNRKKGFTPPLRAGAGFTLIELMLVVIIIGALVAMVLPRFAGRGEKARIQAAKADIQANIATALKLYELDNGNYPSTSEGLNSLLNNPGSSPSWSGPYLEKRPIDPWGREYKYQCPGEHRTSDYDLYSLGKDGVESADDVKNWE